ncbi:MAG: ParB/RepB/Spo0J family partition protein [Candidatus Thermoplasmatota archaeon]
MPEAKIMEIELGKLVPNKYNPRKRMTKKHLASLKKSLERDGQLQTILARPIAGGKFEVVAGMRRYLCLRELYSDKYKVPCTVKDIDDKTAVIIAYKENVEREELDPIAEAGWFFNMLNLKEEQLFTPGTKAGRSPEGFLPLPSKEDSQVVKIATELDKSAKTICERLPLLALPDRLQDLTTRTFLKELDEGEDPMGVEKAEAIARLRLIGNKEKAHEEMLTMWDQWKEKDADEINEHVTTKLEYYRRITEEVLKRLEDTKKLFETQLKDVKFKRDDAVKWLDKKFLEDMPETIRKAKIYEIAYKKYYDAFQVSKNNLEKISKILDDIRITIMKDTTLQDTQNELEKKKDHLHTGLRDITNSHCAYCDSKIDTKELETKIKKISKELENLEKDADIMDEIRHNADAFKKEVDRVVSKLNDYRDAYEEVINDAIKAEKLSEKDGMKILAEIKEYYKELGLKE